MEINDTFGTIRETLQGQRVFGEPVRKDGVTVIPVASVSGGGGGGTGQDEAGDEGGGAGFGLRSRPAGAFVIEDGSVKWQPAVDANKVVATVAAVLIALVVARCRVRSIEARAGVADAVE